MKKLSILFIVLSCVFLFINGCDSESVQDKKIIDIIEKFRNSDYEYKISYSTELEQEETCLYETQGKFIADPYQQFEESNMQDVYVYEKNGEFYHEVRIWTSDEEVKSITFKGDKGDALYLRDDLVFTYQRDEKVDNSKLSVFSSEYERISVIADQDMEVSLPGKVVLEYYVDLKKEIVRRIVVDLSESERAEEIGRYMLEGLSEEEAKEMADQSGEKERMIVVIEIENFGGDVIIERPKIDIPN